MSTFILPTDDGIMPSSEMRKTRKSAVITETELPSAGCGVDAESLSNAVVAHLGRERPRVLRSNIVECLFVLSIVMSMMISDYYISGFNVVLPSIAEALKIPISSRAWPSAVTNLATAALLQPCARLCDMYGSRRVFLGGHAWLFVWSAASGFSYNSTMLIVCRAMKGIGSAAFLPAGLALLSQTYRPGPRKNVVFTIYGAFASVGFCFGLLVGALASEHLNWRWYFWVGAAIGPLICVVGLMSIPKTLDNIDVEMRMDWWGLCTIVPGLVLTVFALGNAPDGGWNRPHIYVSFVLGVLFLIAAVYVQGWISEQPLVPFELFQVKCMKRLFTILFCAYGTFGIFLLHATFRMEEVMGISPTLTAVWFTPLAAGGVLLAGGGLLLQIIPGRPLMVLSSLGFILAMALFLAIPQQEPSEGTSFSYWAYIFPAMIGSTVGVDIAFNVSNVFITTSLPQRLQATASGMVSSLLYLGIAFWLAIVEMVISITTRYADGPHETRNYKIAFWVGLCLSVVALCLTLTVKVGRAVAEMTFDEKQGDSPGLQAVVGERGHS